MSYSVALVGAGPTAIYSVQALLSRQQLPAAITIFERQRRAGQGTPFSANWSDPIMLANIASIEIPPLPTGLVDWLKNEPNARLVSFGIARENLDDRAFYPRLVVGEYLAAQFWELVERARSMGVVVDVHTQATVTDVLVDGKTIKLTVGDARNATASFSFDYVILATGHQWGPDPEIRPGYFTSPWPATALARIRNCAVGMRGTSLSAIDAAVALANQHGEFVKTEGDGLEFRMNPGTEEFSIAMFSRKGVLPEADFYHPIPYEPLVICTADAMDALIAAKQKGLLDAAFDLFRQEMIEADPEYATALSLGSLTLEEFGSAYFEQRAQVDPFDWARRNLAEAVANTEGKVTVAWRYAILRMHEVFGLLPPHLNEEDFARFSDILKPVFVDNYATVPHESVRRVLALHAAARLSVNKLDDDARLDTHSPGRGATLLDGHNHIHFPVFIEATGQQVLSSKDFPFPSLLRQGVVQDVKSDGAADATRGIAVDGAYHPVSKVKSSDRLFCLSLPFLLGQHPFAQGITSSAEMAEVVAAAIQLAERGMTAVAADAGVPQARRVGT
jgi:uncharacterized NAD(P)/FAD-binding protein YdhS